MFLEVFWQELKVWVRWIPGESWIFAIDLSTLWHLISPYNINLESHNKVTRIGTWSPPWVVIDCFINSPCQHPRDCIEKSMENAHTDVTVLNLILLMVNICHFSKHWFYLKKIIKKIKKKKNHSKLGKRKVCQTS